MPVMSRHPNRLRSHPVRPLLVFFLGLAIAATAHAGTAPLSAAVRVAKWQLAHRDVSIRSSRYPREAARANAWQQAAFWSGMTALADRLPGEKWITRSILAMGRSEHWQVGPRPYHADDQAIGQVYVWAAGHGAGEAALAPFRAHLDWILAHPPVVGLAFHQDKSGVECQRRWCWADALFMAPPGWVALSRATGDSRYRRHALAEFRRTADFLYDPAEHLFYRDSRFFERRDGKGRKVFWSRGNGWVFASLARIIPMLPANDPDRRWMVKLFRQMAERLVEIQKPDGYWAPSLLAPEGSPPETSGSSFFTYGLAWGVRAGWLDRARYEPAAKRGWAALLRAVQPDGRLGYVQMIGDRPDAVAASDTQFYGVGGFLFAATAVADMEASDPKR